MRSLPRVPAALAAGLCATLAAGLAGCGRDTPAPRADSVITVTPTVRPDSVPVAPPVARLTWDDTSAGPALFVSIDTTRSAVASAVLPEAAASTPDSTLAAATTTLDGITVDLFALGGKVGTARVVANPRDAYAAPAECAPWPSVRLDGVPRPAGWRVAFSAGRAAAIPVDSLEGLAGADSAARVAEIARLASLVPRTSTKEFAGLPFAVRQARRFAAAGVDILVAEAVRKIPQEANPREQHVLLVAERPAGSRGQYELAYNETSAGDEDRVETRDILAAVRLGGTRTVTLVLNREYEDALAYSLLERIGRKRWRVRWTSAKLGC